MLPRSEPTRTPLSIYFASAAINQAIPAHIWHGKKLIILGYYYYLLNVQNTVVYLVTRTD